MKEYKIPKEKAMKDYDLHIKHNTVGERQATIYAIDIALKELIKQIRYLIDEEEDEGLLGMDQADRLKINIYKLK